MVLIPTLYVVSVQSIAWGESSNGGVGERKDGKAFPFPAMAWTEAKVLAVGRMIVHVYINMQ